MTTKKEISLITELTVPLLRGYEILIAPLGSINTTPCEVISLDTEDDSATCLQGGNEVKIPCTREQMSAVMYQYGIKYHPLPNVGYIVFTASKTRFFENRESAYSWFKSVK